MTVTADHLGNWRCRDRRVIYSMRGRSRRLIMMIGRACFIGLIPRRWITIAAIQWQFLATTSAGSGESVKQQLLKLVQLSLLQ